MGEQADGMREVLPRPAESGEAGEQDELGGANDRNAGELVSDSTFRVVGVPKSLSKWATDSLAAIAKTCHCRAGAVWCLVVGELGELAKQGVRARRGKRVPAGRANGAKQRGAGKGSGRDEAAANTLTHTLDEITEPDNSLDWEWPHFEEGAYGTWQQVTTANYELDVYSTADDDTIGSVAEDCGAAASDVLTFSTYFNSSGHPQPGQEQIG